MQALSTLRSLPFAALATLAAAQTPNNLIALTRNTPMVYQRDHTACTTLAPCLPAGFPAAPPQPYAGGTAWDPVRNAAVISNGFLLAEVDPTTCAYVCPPIPAPTLSPNAMVTGLEFVESLNQIWMIDSFGILYQLQYSCPPTVLTTCNTGLPLTATNATGGLAVDECNGLVFYSYTNWTTGANVIHVASMANPCLTFQLAVPAGCTTSTVPLRGITGLAVDGCRGVLYMTDGIQTIGWNYTVLPGPVVAFGTQSCCLLPMPAGDLMVGLAVRSGRETSTGSVCASGACPLCPMVHTLGNSPNLGNSNFNLRLDQAPTNAFAWCGIGIGPCSAGGPIAVPFCGPLLIGPLAVLLGWNITSAGLPCTGATVFNQPLPMNPTLCGLIASSQCAVICVDPATGAVGYSMSNCISWEVQSN